MVGEILIFNLKKNLRRKTGILIVFSLCLFFFSSFKHVFVSFEESCGLKNWIIKFKKNSNRDTKMWNNK